MLIKKEFAVELDNSMMFRKQNRSWGDVSGDDSFLAMERQCNMDDKKDQLINANDTLLFDIEPPDELWNQTAEDLDQQTQSENNYKCENVEKIEDEDETIEISPVKYIGLIRPSTIIEETSSQLDSYNKNDSLSTIKSSLYETASINDSVTGKSFKSINSLSKSAELVNRSIIDEPIKIITIENATSKQNGSKSNQENPIVDPLEKQKSNSINKERQRRGTFAFKRANYTFFSNENFNAIDEYGTGLTEAEKNKNLIDLQSNDEDSSENEDQFNNTLERVDYLLEKGKQILEETPTAKRNRHHQSLMETPMFSCKRKRLLNEMASIQMLPLAKRGPLIDISTPEILNKMRFNKFSGK